MMPDPAFYTECIRESFEELLAEAEKTGKRAKKTVMRNPKRKRIAAAK